MSVQSQAAIAICGRASLPSINWATSSVRSAMVPPGAGNRSFVVQLDRTVARINAKRSVLGDDPVLQQAHALNVDFDRVAWLHPERWFAHPAHTPGGPGC